MEFNTIVKDCFSCRKYFSRQMKSEKEAAIQEANHIATKMPPLCQNILTDSR